MKHYIKKPVIYRGRLHNRGESVMADPATMAEWLKNGIVSNDVAETGIEDTETALNNAIARIQELEATQTNVAQAHIQELENEAERLRQRISELESTQESSDPIHESGEPPQVESVSAPAPPGIVEGGSGAEGIMPGRDSRKKRG